MRSSSCRRLWVAVVLATVPVASAAAADCSGYAWSGITVGSAFREVRGAMRGTGQLAVETMTEGTFSSSTYPSETVELYVRYDQDVTRQRSGARVILLRARDRSIRSSEAVADYLSTRFGSVTGGRDRLLAELASGGARWVDPVCGVEASARLREPAWWDAATGPHLEIEIAAAPEAAAEAALAADASPTSPPEVGALTPVPDENAVARAGGSRAEPPPSRPQANGSPDSRVAADSSPRREISIVPERRTPPHRLSYVAPEIPQRARLMRLQGTITIEAVVRSDGTVGEVKVLDVPLAGIGLEEAATAAVKQWRYEPATLNGAPIDDPIQITIDFR